MRRHQITLHNPAMQRDLPVIAYGHAGAPVLVFPTSEGPVDQYENQGMVAVLSPFVEAGKIRLYAVASFDSESWYARHRPVHERAARHSLYESWIMNQVVPAIARDVGDENVRLVTTGCSFGAYHAANFTLKHPRIFRHALCLSGVYDIRFQLNGHADDWVYFNNPIDYVANMEGELLEEVRRSVFVTLVCGQGMWEERCIASTRAFWRVLSERRIPNYMDLWGHDVAHDWPWWRAQIVYHMGHLVEGTAPWRRT